MRKSFSMDRCDGNRMETEDHRAGMITRIASTLGVCPGSFFDDGFTGRQEIIARIVTSLEAARSEHDLRRALRAVEEVMATQG